MYRIPNLPLSFELETKDILKQLNASHRQLAELKGIVQTIPNENILINTLSIQEAKDSSEVENIVTTHDDIFKTELSTKDYIVSAAAKEVLNYRQAIKRGFELVRTDKLLTNNIIKEIQRTLVESDAGFRKIPGTELKNSAGKIVYTPPQSGEEVERYMAALERFINMPELCDWDPLVKLAVIHHQFESIHPFYDGNGRTGRIIAILFLVTNDLLNLPVLYLSRYITHNKGEYYRLIQAIRETEDNAVHWQNWVMFILKGIEETAKDTIRLVIAIRELMQKFKLKIRPIFGKQYRHELLNHLFFHPYTKIEHMEKAMMVQRKTAAKYLRMLVGAGFLTITKVKRVNYYINQQLVEVLMNQGKENDDIQ
ncbi:MAG: Fic family protein [Victivallales bacterium]|nr:Fic family protein [Victivallales bacterium]